MNGSQYALPDPTTPLHVAGMGEGMLTFSCWWAAELYVSRLHIGSSDVDGVRSALDAVQHVSGDTCEGVPLHSMSTTGYSC